MTPEHLSLQMSEHQTSEDRAKQALAWLVVVVLAVAAAVGVVV